MFADFFIKTLLTFDRSCVIIILLLMYGLQCAAFGDLPAKEHHDISKIRVGDILKINNNSHSVIVLEVNSNGVVIAEGNINSQVLWGREFSTPDFQQNLTYIWTRYP